MGIFVLIIETRAVKTGVKGKGAACAFMMLRVKNQRPLMRFSKSSEMTCLMLPMLTLLNEDTRVRLSHSVQGQPWYSALPRSCSAAALQGECTRNRSVRTSARQIPPLRQSPSPSPRPFFTFRLFEFDGGHAHDELTLTPSFANRVDVLHLRAV